MQKIYTIILIAAIFLVALLFSDAYGQRCLRNNSSDEVLVFFRAHGCAGDYIDQTPSNIRHGNDSPDEHQTTSMQYVCKKKQLAPGDKACYSFGSSQTDQKVSVINYGSMKN